MYFNVSKSVVPNHNGDYALSGRAYRKLPDGLWAKPDIIHLLDWLIAESKTGVIRVGPHKFYLVEDNKEDILNALISLETAK